MSFTTPESIVIELLTYMETVPRLKAEEIGIRVQVVKHHKAGDYESTRMIKVWRRLADRIGRFYCRENSLPYEAIEIPVRALLAETLEKNHRPRNR